MHMPHSRCKNIDFFSAMCHVYLGNTNDAHPDEYDRYDTNWLESHCDGANQLFISYRPERMRTNHQHRSAKISAERKPKIMVFLFDEILE